MRYSQLIEYLNSKINYYEKVSAKADRIAVKSGKLNDRIFAIEQRAYLDFGKRMLEDYKKI